jgi:polyisoprenyl-phosphate glycosyltransferase
MDENPGKAVMIETPYYTIIVPAFNEAENLPVVTHRILTTMQALDEPFEVILVDDGSTDATAEIIDGFAARYECVRPLHFSRNFGHMAALTAGFEAARGTAAVICLDGDGQHPPEHIPEMIERWKKGADIVQMIRKESPHEGFVKRGTSRLFYRLFNLLSDTEIPAGAADFRLMDREAADALNALPENIRFIRGLVHWVGFRTEHLPFTMDQRFSGASRYTLYTMLRFALEGITSFSVRPLRISYFMAFIVVSLSMLYGGYVLICHATGMPLEAGWSSLLLTVMALGAAQLIAIGIASEYLARLYTEQKKRPVYILRKAGDVHDARGRQAAGGKEEA